MKKSLLILAAAMMSIAVSAQEGELPGKFCVSNGKYVQFSKGNLQLYLPNDTYNFAEQQYDALGNENLKYNADYIGWIDLFGWGTGDKPTYSSRTYSDYATFSDWGKKPITNGGNTADTWRTLTADEWHYLIMERENAEELYALASVNEIPGFVLLPDDWTLPEGSSFTAIVPSGIVKWEKYLGDDTEGGWIVKSGNNPFAQNNYTTEEWTKMEEAGAVFLPSAGSYSYDSPTDIWRLYDLGCYWSSDKYTDERGQAFIFSVDGIYPDANDVRLYERCSVRVVKDVIDETAVENVKETGVKAKKVIEDGRLLIMIPDGRKYDMLGKER